MSEARRLDDRTLARRVAQEFRPADVVALGPGLPSLIPEELSGESGIQFLSDSGALGYRSNGPSGPDRSHLVDSSGQDVSLLPGGSISNLVDVAAMLRGGHVNIAVIQTAQVSATGDFTHWTTAGTPGLFAPGTAVDLASGTRQVIAMMSHTGANGRPNVLDECTLPIDGAGCVDLIITDVAVIRVTPQSLALSEVAPGWRSDAVAALTGAPLTIPPDLREMTFQLDQGEALQKVYASGQDALQDLPDGAIVMIDGFAGPGGMPHHLLVSLRNHGARGLTIISNTAGIARVINFGTPPGRQTIDHSILIENNQVKKAIASYPVSPSASRPSAFELAYRRREVELELVPQGTLAERLRAGGAGIAAFYTPTGAGTLIAEGKESRVIDGKEYVLEQGLRADFCLIRGHKADTLGNVVYKGTSRNFNAVMASAAAVTIVEVDEIVEPGRLDPEEIVTPGIYIDRIVKRPADFSPYE
jgi:3-oxoacid CoA-transferase subunit A